MTQITEVHSILRPWKMVYICIHLFYYTTKSTSDPLRMFPKLNYTTQITQCWFRNIAHRNMFAEHARWASVRWTAKTALPLPTSPSRKPRVRGIITNNRATRAFTLLELLLSRKRLSEHAVQRQRRRRRRAVAAREERRNKSESSLLAAECTLEARLWDFQSKPLEEGEGEGEGEREKKKRRSPLLCDTECKCVTAWGGTELKTLL